MAEPDLVHEAKNGDEVSKCQNSRRQNKDVNHLVDIVFLYKLVSRVLKNFLQVCFGLHLLAVLLQQL